MKKIATLSIALSLLAQEYAVVAHKPFPSLNKSQIKAIFLKKMKLIGHTPLLPLNLPPNDPTRRSFEKEILGMSRFSIKAYWTKMHYLGQRPPLVLSSKKSLVSYIQKVEGAIGYLPKKMVTNKMKILYEWESQ